MDLLPNVCVEFDEAPAVSETPAEVHDNEAPLQKAHEEAHEVSKEHSKAHEDIFEPAPEPAPKVTKKKREATEKQKAHLKIIREKALARKREIQEEKRLEKAVKAHEDEEKRLKKNHYTRAEVDALVITRTEVDALVNQRFTEYQDKHMLQQQEHKQEHMLQQQEKQKQQHMQQHMLMHRKKKSSWDTWI